jgi:hypothetical protein
MLCCSLFRYIDNETYLEDMKQHAEAEYYAAVAKVMDPNMWYSQAGRILAFACSEIFTRVTRVVDLLAWLSSTHL